MSEHTAKHRAKYLFPIIVIFGSLALTVLMEFFPWLSQLERATYDYAFAIRSPLRPSSSIVIVSIDETSQAELGPLPWPPHIYAALLQKLRQGGAKVAAFDVLLDQPKGEDPKTGTDRYLEMAQAIKEFGKVVLGKDISTTKDPLYSLEQVIEPLPILMDAGAVAGFITTPTDPDTRIRRAFWMLKQESTLATEGLYQYSGQPVRLEGETYFIGGFRVPARTSSDLATFNINFVGPAHTIPTRSVYQVLEGTIPPGFLNDKIVFIGADLAAENRVGGPGTDRFPTPADVDVLMPGVEIHANALNTLLTRRFIVTASPGVIWTLLVLSAVLITLYCSALRPVGAGLATAATFCATGVIVCLLFVRYDYWLPSVQPFALMALVYTGNTLVQYRLASRERAQISKAFKHYVSAEVLTELMKNPENLGLGGREVEATVLFTDIAGFSKISEKVTPQELTKLLNQYFKLLTGVIMKEGGVVNKFIGDAVMAIWGAPLDNPNHAIQACRACLQMHRAMLAMDPVKCRIGVNTGRMIAGNMGAEERFEYTVIGDAVNLASRLEGVNKMYHTDIMISETTKEKVQGHFLLREVDSIRVVGKQNPIRIFQLLDTIEGREEAEHQRWSGMIASFNPAMEAYRTRDWEKAIDLFERHTALFPEDHVGKIYLERCRHFLLEPPPENWDGVHQMEAK